jgi:hypothetical protein
MPSRESALVDTAQKIGAFIDDNAALLGPNVAPSRKTLDDAVAQLNAVSITQSGGVVASKGATVRRRALRTTLRNAFMKPVADVAKVKLSDTPEFQALRVPAKQLGSTPLVVAAHAMADAAEAHHPVFTEAGLPDDFIGQLRDAADTVTAAQQGLVQQTAAARSTTLNLNAQETSIRNLFRLIDALVRPKLGTNVALLAKWKATKAVPAVSAVTAATQPPATSSSATTASTNTTSAPAVSDATMTAAPATAAAAPAHAGPPSAETA